jgi:predicted esterase
VLTGEGVPGMLHRIGRESLLTVAASFVLCITVLGADVDALMEAFFVASDQDERTGAIEQLVLSGIGASEIASRLRAGRVHSGDVVHGWSVHYNECIDDVARPYHVFVPDDYDPTVPIPVLFDLHGGIAREEPYPVESLMRRRGLWEPTASEEGWILVVPHGDAGATWWSEAGRSNLLAQLAFLKYHYNVDENRVFLSGFSDGGTGALWMGFHDATAWAGFVDVYGHPNVAGYGPYQTYPRNLLNRPIRASSGSYDELYPAPEIRLYVDQLLDLGVDIDWTAHPTDHDIEAAALERPAVVSFIERVEREPHPAYVIWETSDVIVGRCDWVRIDEIADVGNNLGFKDANIWPLKDEIRFGASFAYRGADVGFVVAGVEPGSIAHFAGVKTDDRVVRIDENPIETGYEIPAIIEGMNPGAPVEIEVIRDGEPLVLEGQVTPIEALYPRDEMTGSIEAVVSGNRVAVTVRNVARYTLLISSELFDLNEPIVVVTNGVETFSGIVEPDVRFMLEQAARDDDRRTVYEARIEIVVPPVE